MPYNHGLKKSKVKRKPEKEKEKKKTLYKITGQERKGQGEKKCRNNNQKKERDFLYVSLKGTKRAGITF